MGRLNERLLSDLEATLDFHGFEGKDADTLRSLLRITLRDETKRISTGRKGNAAKPRATVSLKSTLYGAMDRVAKTAWDRSEPTPRNWKGLVADQMQIGTRALGRHLKANQLTDDDVRQYLETWRPHANT